MCGEIWEAGLQSLLRGVPVICEDKEVCAQMMTWVTQAMGSEQIQQE